MSILSFPRVNFRGVFRTNPCTANNDDVMPAVVERDVDALGATVAGMTDGQVQAYLREQVSMSNQPGATCTNFVRSGWNLYGDHFTSFDDTTITSVVTGPTAADRATTAAQDPLVGQQLLVLGSQTQDPLRRGDAILCDLDATGLVTTQLFVGGLQIGSGGENGIDPSKIVAQFNYDTRGFQNWLNFNSTVGPYGGEQNFVGIGCVMQFAISASAIPPTVTFASQGLQQLLAAARAAAGLVVRFRCYEVQPGLRDESLYAAFQQGNAVDNPGLGYLVGTIGVWGVGEPATEPAGRKLEATYPRPDMYWNTPNGQTPTLVPGTPQAWAAAPALIGNAVASVQQSPPVISLDIVESFPKFGFRDPDGPEQPTSRGFSAPRQMANVGTVQLAVIPAGGGAPTPITAVDYGYGNYSAYEDFGGIVDLPYNPALFAAISSGTLVLQGTGTPNAGVTLLQEQPIRVVTDDRTAYWLPNAQNQSLRIKVYDRGGPTTVDTTLYLFEYANIIQIQTPAQTPTQSPTPTPTPTVCSDGIRPNQSVGTDQPGILTFSSQVIIPAGQGYNDWFNVTVSATAGGATILSYQLDNVMYGTGFGGVAGVPVWSTANYSSIRVFADDDFSALYAKGPLQWADVYANVLRYYYLIYPAMSRFIPLNLADSIVPHGALIGQRLHTCDNPEFYGTHNMPVTRTMSPAKVKLLLDFINQQSPSSATVAG